MDAGSTKTTARILGLTGPIGCGKTTVGDLLLELGARARIDADKVVHRLMVPDTEVTAQIAETFGAAVLKSDGAVDRKQLAAMVFADPEQLRRLEAIVHPAVRNAIRTEFDGLADGGGVVMIDAVKLLQSELIELVEAVWVVECSRDVQLQRLTVDRGMTAEAAIDRLKAQPSFDAPRVTRVIDNSDSREKLRSEVARAWHEFVGSTQV